MKIDGKLSPIDLGVPFLEPGHTEDNLEVRESNDHEFDGVSEGSRSEGDNLCPTNGSLVVGGSINVISGNGGGYWR